MPAPTHLRPSLLPIVGLAIAILAAACATQVAPTGSVPAGSNAATASPGATAGGPTGSGDGVASPGASQTGGGIATLPPSGDAGSPPPVGDPQDAEACLAVVPRADVETALGTSIGDIVAVGTDPAVSLTCTYTAGDGSLLVSTTAGDPATAFQQSLDLAAGYAQSPVAIDGLGDQAFYAKAADRWPEQVVFVKGPVLVRLVNQTDATIGEVPFAALAAIAADAIHAEIPPAP